MPRKVRELEADLKKAGFAREAGKGSHRNYRHENGTMVTISGKEGEDAKHYQEKAVKSAIEGTKP